MINRVTLVGRTGEDPNYQILTDGTELVDFQFATSEKWKDQETTEWHTIKMFGPMAQIMQKHGFKGQRLYLEGKIHYTSWKDKAGNMRYGTEIICNTVKIMDWKDDS